MSASPERASENRKAYGAWQEQIASLHRVVLDGERMDPPRLKGPLNRETRAKERYDAARLALLGIDAAAADPFG